MIAEHGPNLARLREEYREVVANASTEMAVLFYDVFDSLTTNIPESMPPKEKEEIETILETMQAFIDSEYILINPHPRSPRSTDTIEFLPGQHKGISIQYVSESGDLGFMNIYGGMRDSNSGIDYVDQDRTLRVSHSTRTDRILSQPVQINFHMKDAKGEKLFDVWIAYRLNRSFELKKAIGKNSSVDFSARLEQGDHTFEDLNRRFGQFSRTLTTFIPSAD